MLLMFVLIVSVLPEVGFLSALFTPPKGLTCCLAHSRSLIGDCRMGFY